MFNTKSTKMYPNPTIRISGIRLLTSAAFLTGSQEVEGTAPPYVPYDLSLAIFTRQLPLSSGKTT